MKKYTIISYSYNDYEVENKQGDRVTIIPDKKHLKLLREYMESSLTVKDDEYNVHKVYHKYIKDKERVGVEKAISRQKENIFDIRCDDADFMGASLILIPHISKWCRMGVTVELCTQYGTTEQNKFFLYPNHLDDLIDSLKKIRKIVKSKPEYDRKSPLFKRKEQISRQLLKYVHEYLKDK